MLVSPYENKEPVQKRPTFLSSLGYVLLGYLLGFCLVTLVGFLTEKLGMVVPLSLVFLGVTLFTAWIVHLNRKWHD